MALSNLQLNIIKIILVSAIFSLSGLAIYFVFLNLNHVIALYGLVLVFVGLTIFFFIPEYVIWSYLNKD